MKNCLKVLVLLSVLSVEAREIEGVAIPETVTVASNSVLTLQGGGLRRQFLLRVYVASLYAPKLGLPVTTLIEGTDTKVLTLKFLRDVDWDDVTEALEEGLNANTNKKELARMSAAIEEMNALIKRVGGIQEGGVLRLDLTADSARFSLNDTELGAIVMPGLGKALLKIWLGEHPAQESLKRKLLGER